MPLTSIFTPAGALECSSKPSRIETIYRAIIANLGDNYDTSPGTNVESFVYARARELARARYVVERAYNNANPLKATETLPDLENEFGIIPGPTDDLPARRATLAARMQLPGGATYANVSTALATLLGSDFIYYRVTKSSEVTNFPATGGDSPGNFVLPSTTLRNIVITSGISTGLGAPKTVNWVPFNPADSIQLVPGDKLVVDPKIDGICESVTIATATSSSLTATFTKPHDANTFATTQSYPYWVSNKRHSLVIVKAAAALNAETRRKIHELMSRIARGVSTWDIVPNADATHTAAFTVEDATLGRVQYAGLTSVVYP